MSQSERYASHPVAMFVRVKVVALVPPGPDGEPHDDLWSPWADLIDTVYADRAMGRKATGCDATVDVGRWLLTRGLFKQHSPSRADAGECWARRVEGPLPDRTETLDPDIIRRNGAGDLERIRAEWPWPAARVPANG